MSVCLSLLPCKPQIEERVRSATERLQRVRRQGQDLTRLGLTDKEAANQKLQATLQRTIKVPCRSPAICLQSLVVLRRC